MKKKKMIEKIRMITVTEDFIESRVLAKEIVGNKFEIGEVYPRRFFCWDIGADMIVVIFLDRVSMGYYNDYGENGL